MHASTCVAEVIPDARYLAMYRLKLHDEPISDMVNLTRAKDAALRRSKRVAVSPGIAGTRQTASDQADRNRRTEQEIFDDLAALCASPGYAHALAFLCYRDNFVGYRDELKGKDYSKLFSMNRLIRTELLTLIGLMARAPIDYALPSQQRLQNLVDHTEALLNELHEAMLQPLMANIKVGLVGGATNPFATAEAMREAIFYSGDLAFSFQYRDLAPIKYARDELWLRQNKGFSIEEARQVAIAISTFLHDHLLVVLRGLNDQPPESRSVLDGFKFCASDIVPICTLHIDLINTILSAFAHPDDGNPSFTALHEFNAITAYPLLKMPDDNFILFNILTESIYDTPFYWMAADKQYEQVAMTNRGMFTEQLGAERLEHVFGATNVFRNVDIWQSKGNILGEIDTLVLFGNHAIVLQAKSKKLTLIARKGNDLQLKSDFKAAVQDACDQAYLCSQALSSAAFSFIDRTGKEVTVDKSINKIHQICLISDHYPALSTQSREFLKYQTTDKIQSPLVCDVFLLDVMTEMLETPLRFLSYLELRALVGDKVLFSHEMTALGYHLKQNLWFEKYDLIYLEDNVSADLHIAMLARRDGIERAKGRHRVFLRSFAIPLLGEL